MTGIPNVPNSIPNINQVNKKGFGSTAGKALGTLGKVQTALSAYDTAKQGFHNARQEWKFGTNPYDSIMNSKIAEIISAVKEEKFAMALENEKLADAKTYAKDLGKSFQGGLQKGINGLIPTAAVLGASYLVNRNLKSDMSPVRASNEDIKNSVRYKLTQAKKQREMDKEAAESNFKPWGEFGKDFVKNIPHKAVEGIGMALPAAAITLAVGKNIRGRGETIPTRRPEYKEKILRQKYMSKDKKD